MFSKSLHGMLLILTLFENGLPQQVNNLTIKNHLKVSDGFFHVMNESTRKSHYIILWKVYIAAS